MSYPQTQSEIKSRLDTIDGLIALYMSDPTKFAEQIGGTIKISMPEYVRQLREERDIWHKRLCDSPWELESDIEGTL